MCICRQTARCHAEDATPRLTAPPTGSLLRKGNSPAEVEFRREWTRASGAGGVRAGVPAGRAAAADRGVLGARGRLQPRLSTAGAGAGGRAAGRARRRLVAAGQPRGGRGGARARARRGGARQQAARQPDAGDPGAGRAVGAGRLRAAAGDRAGDLPRWLGAGDGRLQPRPARPRRVWLRLRPRLDRRLGGAAAERSAAAVAAAAGARDPAAADLRARPLHQHGDVERLRRPQNRDAARDRGCCWRSSPRSSSSRGCRRRSSCCSTRPATTSPSSRS